MKFMDEKKITPAERIVPEEVDYLFIIKLIYSRKKTILSISLFTFLVSILIIYFKSPKGFEATINFMVKTDNQSTSENLSQLATIAGGVSKSPSLINGSEVTPALYPEIIKSINFKRSLIKSKIRITGLDRYISYSEFYDKFYHPDKDMLRNFKNFITPNYLLNMMNLSTINSSYNPVSKKESHSSDVQISFVDSLYGVVRINEDEQSHFTRVENQIEVGSKNGLLYIKFFSPDPLVSAQMANNTFLLLQNEIINFKLSQVRNEISFTESQFLKKKREFEESQYVLGKFKEKNQNQISPEINNKLEILEADYKLKFGLFSEVARNLENQKIQIAKISPVFSVIDPPTIPNVYKSGYSWWLSILGFIAGLFVGILFVLSRILYNNFILKLNSFYLKV